VVGDDGVRGSLRPQLRGGRGHTFVQEQQQRLVRVLRHGRLDGDERAEREGRGGSRAREVVWKRGG